MLNNHQHQCGISMFLYQVIEQKLPGFGGAFVDNSGKFNIYVTDPSKVPNDVQTILTGYIDQRHLEKGVVIQKGTQPWHQWAQWESIANKLFDQKDLGVTEVGIDDKKELLLIGVEKLDSATNESVNTFLAENQIPQNMVELVQTGKTIPLTSGLTLNPIRGAAEIGVVGWNVSPPVCTTGFIVKDSSGNYRGLTAGHCMASANWNNGQQQYDQPNNGRYIGNQISGTLKETYSDSILFTTGETGGFGKIYEYGQGTTISITGAATGGQFVGDTVCFSGTATNNTVCNQVTQVGINKPDPGLGVTLKSQNQAGFFATNGDSGSPVWNPNGGVTAYGIVWGVDTGTWYSPVAGINSDQGTLQYK